MQRRGPRGEFPITRRNQRGAKQRQFRVSRAILGEERFDRRTVGQVGNVFRLADDLLEPAEEKDLHSRGWGRCLHKWIVTRESVPGYWLRLSSNPVRDE